MRHEDRPTPTRKGTAGGETTPTLADLRVTLNRASSLLQKLLPELESMEQKGAGSQEVSRLHRQLAELNSDHELLTQQLIETENQSARTLKLYVATYQLHASLDPEKVQAAILEVAGELLGAKTFVLLLPNPDKTSWRMASAQLEGTRSELFSGDSYSGGDPCIDATLRDSVLRIEQDESSSAIAAVPLRVEDEMVGVLAVFELLEHRSNDLFHDRDLLDVLSAHAGSALLAAEVYATTRRKLKTLRSLLSLLPGSSLTDAEPGP